MNDRRRLSDLVASRIRDYIIEHDLQAGDRLPTELELAKQFGVSRVSIREATKSLCFLGFLEATPRRGTTVGQVNFSRVSPFLELHPAFRHVSARDLVDSWLVLELGVLPFVSDRFQQHPAAVEDFRRCFEGFSPEMDLGDWLEMDGEFHRRMMDASGLTPLFLFHELLEYIFRRVRRLAESPETQERLCSQMADHVAEQQRIISLLRDHQPRQAHDELKRHISNYLPLLTPPAVN